MCSKYCSSPHAGNFNSTSQQQVLFVLHSPILAYADIVERMSGMESTSNAWAGHVLAALEAQLDITHHGTPLHPATLGLVPYNTRDRREMHSASCKALLVMDLSAVMWTEQVVFRLGNALITFVADL